MTYFITLDSGLLLKTLPAFQNSYAEFLGSKTEATFHETVENILCASIIIENDEVFAFCFHREMQCLDWKNPPAYMADTPEFFRKYIENKYRILTIEWLTVAPKYLGKFSKVQPADLMLGSAFAFMKNSVFNACMGFSRQDTKVDQMTTRFGTKLHGTVNRFDIPCSVVLMEEKNLVGHPIKKTQERIDELWQSKINHLSHLERKKAA